MNEKIYLDSNVFISARKQEFDSKELMDFSYFSELLFEEIVGCRFKLVFSDLVFLEITKKFPYFRKELESFLEKLKQLKKVELVRITERDIKRAKQLKQKSREKLEANDYLHVALAERSCKKFISWEKKHKCIDFCFNPQEII